MDLREKILNLVKSNGNIAISSLHKIPEFNGDCYMGNIEKNIIFTSGASEEGISILWTLFEEGRIELLPTSPFVCMADGGKIPNLPLAEDLKKKYKKPRWLPTLIEYKKNEDGYGLNTNRTGMFE